MRDALTAIVVAGAVALASRSARAPRSPRTFAACASEYRFADGVLSERDAAE